MSYVLGFFCADGSMIINPRGSHYIEFQNTEPGLLEKFRDCLNSNHKISKNTKNKNWKPFYRMQIGSKEIFNDLLKLNISPKKKTRLQLPKIPNSYFPDFVRGYFDGDGNIWYGYQHKKGRKKATRVLLARFTNGNKKFLTDLASQLTKRIKLSKTPSILFHSGAYRLSYSTNDSIKLYKFIYSRNSDLYFVRKKKVFEKFMGR